MSTIPPVSTGVNGQPATGTQGTQIGNDSAGHISDTEFLNLMMDQLEHQDPLDPSSSDPTQYLNELAQMTNVEEATATASSTAQTATAQSVSQAIGLIGDTVTYKDAATDKDVTGTVQSVQITSTGPTLTIGGASGIDLSTITNVTAATGGATAGGTTSGGTTSGGTTSGGTSGSTGAVA